LSSRIGVIGLALNDAKLAIRALSSLLGPRSPRLKALIFFSVFALLHAVAYLAATRFAPSEHTAAGLRQMEVAARSATILLLPWTIAATMTAVTRMLFQRGDLDLLLTSPLSPRRIVAARLLGQAFESVAAIGLILLPFAHVNAALGRPHWLAIYPALAAAGLIGAGLGFLIALNLFFLVGARRARIVSQIVATLVGASAVVVAQILALLPEAWRQAVFSAFSAQAGQGDFFGRLLEIPERAALGDFGPLVAWLGIATALFAFAVFVRGPAFVAAAMASAGAPSSAGRTNGRPQFLIGLGGALRVKEHRLLARDPWLISQMLMQALYTVPVGIVMWRHGGVTAAPGVAFGPMLVIIAGQFSGALAWLALSAEDAPDFLMTAPATRGQIERAKLVAILEPVAITMAVPMLMLMWAAPFGGLTAIACAAGASASGALLMLWRQAPARRGMVLRRHSQSKVLALGEHWLSMLWAATDAIAAFGSWTFVVPLAMVAVTLWFVSPSRAARIAPVAATA
jgi:ABC-2 type transport system permease protein